MNVGASAERGNYRWIVLAVVLLADLAFGTTTTILGASLGEVADDLDAEFFFG